MTVERLEILLVGALMLAAVLLLRWAGVTLLKTLEEIDKTKGELDGESREVSVE